jgi:hypothetical protein
MEELKKIIGENGITDLAKHWFECGDKMEKLMQEELFDFYTAKKPNHEEAVAFQDGLSRIANIYEECALYIENKNKDKKELPSE